ncbi:MAG: lytic transglycosylase domain-containing protein [Desulfobacteraceae bacterium]|nr:lytic transglycosylase domain-containing protein [Desulfobacteraceae bacterium]
MYPQNKGKKSLAKTVPLLPLATPAVPSIKTLMEVEMTSKQKNAENRYQLLILEAAYRYKVEPAIIKAIIMAESSFNPKAVSRVGARGLMQLMPRTARSLGVEDSFKPAHNIDAGVRYFKHLLDQFDGEIKLALAAYNAGSFNVRKYGGIPPFKATKFYINKVLKYYETYRTT